MVSALERLGRNHHFEDPFMREFDISIEILTRVIDKNGVLPDHVALYPSIQALRHFRQNYYYNSKALGALNVVTSEFAEYERLYKEVLAIIEIALKRARSEWRKEYIASQLQSYKDRLDNVRSFKNKLTPAHLEFQNHFYKLVVMTPRGPQADDLETADFFGPLYDLRNEYFHQRRPGLIQEYLAKSKELLASDYYAEVVRYGLDADKLAKSALIQADIEDHVVELEFLDMFEELDYPVAV